MKFLLSFTALGMVVFSDGKVPPKKVAAIVTEYRHNSHADVIVGRLLQTYTLDDKGERPNLELVSLYLDQTPENDTGHKWAKKHGVPIHKTIRGALTLGSGKLAVDGVLLIAEHGNYPRNAFGSQAYPKRRFFEETQKVFRESGHSVPVFVDKHLSDNWADAKWCYDVSRELDFPLLAGSSLPLLWRYPPQDVSKNAELQDILVTTYHSPDAYGFHALEVLQCLVERRASGETGVRRVKCLEGNAVWQAGKDGLYDVKLLNAAIAPAKHHSAQLGKRPLEQLVKKPILFHIQYRDGLKASIINLDGATWEWCAAWREKGKENIQSTLFWTQEKRPYGHFTFLVQGIENTFHTNKPTWPTERTLLTTGLLDALLRSKSKGGEIIETPHLAIPYKSDWSWKEPPAPPKERPWNKQ